jgi:acetate CoA/acetoacetate CoA-transferase beta subunit
MNPKEYIAQRVAAEFEHGDVVNLGIGLPSLISHYVDPQKDITFQSENGLLGLVPLNDHDVSDPNLTNAGGAPTGIAIGGACFDSAQSFAMIRGGHIDVTVIGALQVDASGNIANWIIPGKKVPGMGGAMDLVVGSQKVIVAMLHTSNGVRKILKKCTLPLTAKSQVNLIITEMAVIEVTPSGLKLKEIAPHSSLKEIIAHTEAPLDFSLFEHTVV